LMEVLQIHWSLQIVSFVKPRLQLQSTFHNLMKRYALNSSRSTRPLYIHE
ncbi:hypothetical protein S245_047939, partial [Arachis hypogaea]